MSRPGPSRSSPTTRTACSSRSPTRSPRPVATGRSSRASPRQDVDAAMAALNTSLQAAFNEAMADPSLAAGGATVFPSTGTLGPTDPDRAARDPRRPGGRDLRARACRRPARSSPPTPRRSRRSPRRSSGRRSSPITSSCRARSQIEVGDAGRRRSDRQRPGHGIGPAGRGPRPRAPDEAHPGQADRRGARDPRAVRHVRDQRLAGLVRLDPELREPGGPHRLRGGPDRDAGTVGLGGSVTRLLGIDLGERRVGLAIGDDDGSRGAAAGDDPARPDARRRRSGPARDRRAPKGSTALVVGLPLEASGAEGPQAALTRAWADAVAERFGTSGYTARRAPEQPPRRDPPRPDEARPIRRAAEQDPARCLSGAGRSRGRGHHPPGRARHTRRPPFVHHHAAPDPQETST